MNASEHEKRLAILKERLLQLGEHFDAVQIFATSYEGGPDGHTATFSAGDGNMHTRIGQVRNWLIQQDESLRVEVRARRASGRNEDEE